MHSTTAWAILALAAGLSATAAEPLKHSLVHGVFKSAEAGATLPLQPTQKLESIQNGNSFRVVNLDGGEPMAFPVFAKAGSTEAASLKDIDDAGETFLASLDLAGTGTSDIIYTNKNMNGWKVLTNGARLPKPVQGFVAGYFEKGSDTRKAETFAADTRDLKVDQNLLAAVGDFLGNGTEQLAYARPGGTHMYVVGAHGVLTMKADLKGIEPAGSRTHWIFPFKANRKGQHTRLAYYRMGSNHLLRLVPKGMEFHQEKVPLKGHWHQLNQEVLDWPQAAPASDSKKPEAK